MPIRQMPDKREMDQERLKELAFIDDLTTLYNRRYLYQYLPTELADMQRLHKTLSLFMIDVDNFKEINDAHGHLCGDRILVGIAEILQASFRHGDTIIRYAGDEFVAILPGADEDTALNIAHRIIEGVNQKIFRAREGGSEIRVTISIGLALFPRDGTNPERLIHQADQALYSSKRSGRNRSCTTREIPVKILDEAKLGEILPCAQLIGRQKELEALRGLLSNAENGQSEFALIRGERGVGKTRLITELKNYAQLKGITNIFVSCAPEISAQPYQILITALESLFASLGAQVREFIRSLPEAQTAQLANYIPVLKRFLPENFRAPKISADEQAQRDLFKGICQSLIYVVKRNTFLLLIDDFHWIDQGTLLLFNYIISEMQNLSIFIVGAMRDEELERDPQLAAKKQLLQELLRNKIVEDFLLQPLEKEDVAAVVRVVFPNLPIRPELTDILYEVGAGNPLFTEETLRTLVDNRYIYYQDGLWHCKEISKENVELLLKGTLQKRFYELDEETRPVISAAAVMGEAFDFDTLCQVLDRDPGYVLEVIDRAARQQLISPQSHLQSDKFKFNSGIIREAIYANLAEEEKQMLHRKLALIEEELHKDNVDAVAGSLGYHFAKAEDREKAALYTERLLKKVNRMPTYDDVFNFLQESLLERAEETVVPLSDESMKFIPPLIRSLRLATQNVRLYPAHSTIRRGFIEQAYKNLTQVLKRDELLVIGTAENRLLINGEEISERISREAGVGGFISFMINQRIKSITIKRDLRKEELVIFLEGLSRGHDDLLAQGGLAGILRKNDISSLRVNEVRYEQTTRLNKQRTKFEEAMLMDYLIGKISNLDGDKGEIASLVANDPQRLAQTLKKIAGSVEKKKGEDKVEAEANIIVSSLQKLGQQILTKGPGGLERYRKAVAGAMMNLDSQVRALVSQSQLKVGKTAIQDLIKDASEEFSDAEVLKVIDKQFSQSGDSLSKLRGMLRRVLDPRRRHKLAADIKVKLAQEGLSEEEIAWALEENFWKGLSLPDKVQRALKITPQNYLKLQREISEQIDKLVAQLLAHDRYSEAAEIVNKLLRQLTDESKAVRETSARDIQKISEMLIASERYFLLEQIINTLVTRLDREKDPQVYAAVTAILANSCVQLIRKQNFTQATGILKEFNLRLEKTSKLLDIQRQAIKAEKQKSLATPALVNWLTGLLEEKISGHYDFYELSQVISELGQATIAPLFALAISKDDYSDPFKTYALRWSIAKVLKDMGNEAVLYLKDRLNEDKPETISATLKLLGHMRNKDIVRYLYPLIKHKDFHLRKETITTLGKIGGPEAIRLLGRTIKDRDQRIRLATVWALANIGGAEVLPLLKPLLKEEELADEVSKIIQRIEPRKPRKEK